jgi:cellulose biosynthesis protein BcsQ
VESEHVMPIGAVTTFYSYKGGVGRTFLLANVAWLLARWGRKVLCLDWDLEAPGLTRYLAPSAPPRPGVLDLVEVAGGASAASSSPQWTDLREPVSGPWTGSGRLDLIAAGRQDDDYIDRVQKLDWDALFAAGLSPRLEELRAEWVAGYDHVLLDSRTGVTDIGSICAAQLPDLLVMAFTANHQSLEGTVQVARRVEDARSRLPLDRGGLNCLPVPSRVHVGEESLLEHEWFARFEKVLAPLFEPWKERNVDVREYLQQLRVREFSRWSFGEQLPVREERLDDPALVSWAFANIAALIDRRLDESGKIARERHAYIGAAAGSSGLEATSASTYKPIDVFISHPHEDTEAADALYEALVREGASVFVDTRSLELGDQWDEALYRARERAKMIVVLLSHHYKRRSILALELDHVARLAKEQSTAVVPIFLDSEGFSLAPPDFQQRFGIFRDDELSWDDIARRLVRQLRTPRAPAAPSGAPTG